MANDIQVQIQDSEKKLLALKDSVMKRANYIKAGLAVVVLAIIAPIAISGVVGALALSAIGVIALVAVNGFPVLAKKLANAKVEALIAEENRHLQALKAEANRNPIETLENEQRSKHKDLTNLQQEIQNFEAEVGNLRDTVNGESKFASVSQKGKEVLASMERKLRYRQVKFQQAVQAVKLFDEKVDEAKAMYRVALAAQRADAASGENDSTVMRKILEDTAFTSVSSTVNNALAGLRTSLLKDEVTEEDLKQLDYNPSQTIDVVATPVKQGVAR